MRRRMLGAAKAKGDGPDRPDGPLRAPRAPRPALKSRLEAGEGA